MLSEIYTKPSYQGPKGHLGKLIFQGQIPHLLRKGDNISVLEGYCVETVDYVYYDVHTNSQEIHLTGKDPENEYPEIKDDKTWPA